MATRRVNTGQKVELLWNCAYCETKKILARHKNCPNCGRSREGGAYLGDNPNSRILSKEDEKAFTGKPDWHCEYCGSMNPSNINTCRNCGSSRDESTRDYFDVQREQIKNGELPPELKLTNPQEVTSRLTREDTEQKKEEQTKTHESNDTTEETTRVSHPTNLFKLSHFKNIKAILISLVIFIACGLSIFGIVCACAPKNDTITVQSLAWERNIYTEIEKTVFENNWNLPTGARLRYTKEEFHHNDKVIDHYEMVEVTEYKYEKVGERTWTEYEQNGDGTADVINCSEDIYDNVPYTHMESQPVYKDVPVNQTKYYYDIDKWVYNRTLTTDGNDHNVYWSEESLLTNEREQSRNESYFITAVNKKGEIKTYTLDYQVWKGVKIGDTFNVKVHMTGKIEILDDNGNILKDIK